MALIYAGAVSRYGNFTQTSKDERRRVKKDGKTLSQSNLTEEKDRRSKSEEAEHQQQLKQSRQPKGKGKLPMRKRSTSVTDRPPKIVVHMPLTETDRKPVRNNAAPNGQLDFRKLLAHRKQHEYEKRGIRIQLYDEDEEYDDAERWPKDFDVDDFDDTPMRKRSMSWNSGLNSISLQQLEAFDNRQKLKKGGTMKKLQKQIKKIVL